TALVLSAVRDFGDTLSLLSTVVVVSFFHVTAAPVLYTLSLHDALPILQPLCRQLRERISTASPASSPAPAPGATPSPAPAPVPDPGSVGGSTGPDIIVSPRDAHRALRSLQEQARSICQWWQSQSLTDPRAMSLSRCLLWLPIEAMPEHDASGRTQLRGLPADRLQQFQERLGQGQP